MREVIWKDIPETDGYFQVSNTGLVKRLARKIPTHNNGYVLIVESLCAQIRHKKGYLYVDYKYKGKRNREYVHRLVAQAFIPNREEKPAVNHKDGDKMNNNKGNLEWCTNQENTDHALEIGLMRRRKSG